MLFIREIYLRFLWLVILSSVVTILALIAGFKEGIPMLLLIVFIFILFKKINILNERKPFIMRFWDSPIEEKKGMLSNNKEEKEEQLNVLIDRIKNDDFSMDIPIKLNNNERAFFSLMNAEWHEIRSTTKSISYGNIQQTFKLTEGLKIRLGNVKPMPHKKTDFTKIAQGDFYITNKRILLVSPVETKKIEMSDILNVNLFRDGILIQKDSGKAVLIPMQEDEAMIAKAILDNI